MRSKLRTVIPVWIVVTAAAIATAVVYPGASLQVLPIVMAAAVLLTFGIQIAIVQRDGLVERVMLSVGGAILILAAATLVSSVAVGA